MRKHFFFIVALVLFNSHFSAQDWNQIGIDIDGKLSGDRFGWSVGLSANGNRLVIGAPLHGIDNDFAGQVLVYEQLNGQWTQLGAAINGTEPLMSFGLAVAISDDGNRIAIGAPKADPFGIDIGAVRVFELVDDSWMQLGESIIGSFMFDQAGQSVAFATNGNRVAVGAHLNDGNGPNRGHVRVFDFIDHHWVQIGTNVNGESTSMQSGWSVALSDDGDIMAVGAISNNENGFLSGQVRTYLFNGVGWAQLGSDINGEMEGDRFGWSLDLSNTGERLAIGAPQNIESSDASGYIKIYELNSGNWTLLGDPILGEGVNSEFGAAVSFNGQGNAIAVGAPAHNNEGDKRGLVRFYEFNNNNWASSASPIFGEDAGDLFGHSVAFNSEGNTIAIGAILNSSESNNSGHVRVYEPGVLSVEGESKASVNIYPNPSTTHISIDGIISPTNLVIMDISGRTLLRSAVVNSNPINVQVLASGTYFVQLFTTDQRIPFASKKIIVR